MARTSYTYCTPSDVADFILSESGIDANTSPNKEQIARYIQMAEGEIEARTGSAWQPVWVEEERYDQEAFRSRHREHFQDGYYTAHRPIHLNHHPILPISSSRGHQIEVYEGSEDANGEWTDYVTTKTEGRDQDWWVDYQQGILYIRKSFLFRRNALVRVTYEYGRPIPTLNGALNDTDTTITVQAYHSRPATWGLPARGTGRIGDEYVTWTGKTATTLTGVTRGELNTTAASHSDGDELVWVPADIRSASIHYAAAKLLENERFLSPVADNAGSAPDFASLTERWMKHFDQLVGGNHAKWAAV